MKRVCYRPAMVLKFKFIRNLHPGQLEAKGELKMTVKKIQCTDEFMAEAEDGRRFRLLVYTVILDAGTASNPHATINGSKSIKTSEGDHVNYIDDLNYEIVELGIKVKKI